MTMSMFIKKVCIALLVIVFLTNVSLAGMLSVSAQWNEIVLVDIRKRARVESIK